MAVGEAIRRVIRRRAQQLVAIPELGSAALLKAQGSHSIPLTARGWPCIMRGGSVVTLITPERGGPPTDAWVYVYACTRIRASVAIRS